MSALLMAAAGFLFALGLGISGMTDANKVIAFLDLAEGWDPSLAFVMVGAIGVHALAWAALKRREGPLTGGSYQLPSATQIDPRLLGGAALFGLGWGLGGFCPGPALVSLTSLTLEVGVFVACMLGGMLLFHALDRTPPPSP